MGEAEGKLQKSYFDVLGLCCSSEVPLIEKILQPLKGVDKVTVIVPSRTVIVVHDPTIISQLEIVNALNKARLEASIRAYGNEKMAKKWPNPYILACGLLLLVSLFKYLFSPLQWFALAAVVIGLPPIILRSIAAIRRFTLDINILMVIAVGGSIAMKDYSEAGFIVFLFTIAEWLESRAGHKATAGMSMLMSMAPQKAIMADTGKVVDVKDVKVNSILAVKAGEVIPIDGVVVEGRSEVDESSLTGESFPVSKQAESPVWAGTLNIDGYISVKTTALAENSTVAKMAKLVEEAQNSRSKTQTLIDSCTKYYTPAVVIIAACVALIPLILRAHNMKHWYQFALVLLVSSCPCALVLSTPVATFCALLMAARTGLLVKGGDVLEALAKTKVVALDKTGTITKGEFTVMEFQKIGCEVTLEKLLYWVSSIESKSSHPMASALVEHARTNSIEPKPDNVNEFSIYPGEGICGEIEGKIVYVGNRRIGARAGCSTVPNTEKMKDAVTIGYVYSGAVPIGIFTLSDTCRTGALEAIKELKSLGIKTAMLTGDSNKAAMNAQKQLGNAIEIVHAELLPEDKVRLVSDLKVTEGCTVMVGDGLNDAPALAKADVGISMGISGSAVAMETSHITLMSNDIRKIPKAIRLARRTQMKIIVNISFSLITKVAIVALAIAGHPILWAAVLADVGTCLVVILNSMMLLQVRSSEKKHSHSSHKSPGKCCGSSEKSHTHKSTCADHCAGAKCGSAAVRSQSECAGHLHDHSSNDHGTTGKEGACRENCSHDHKTTETRRAYRRKSFRDHSNSLTPCKGHDHVVNSQTHSHCDSNSSTPCKGHDHRVNSQTHSHCDAEPVAYVNASCHEHLISITNGAEYPKDGLHEHNCHKPKPVEKERACRSNCCHDHETVERPRKCNSFHDHGMEKEEKAQNHCSINCNRDDHHVNSHIHSHCGSASVAHVTNASHEHLISIPDGSECHKNEQHEKHRGDTLSKELQNT